MNPSAASSNNNQEGLVNKLQGALSKFRNERDQLHRSKELALEKCLLVQQEADALQTSVSSMKDKFTMKRKVSETLKKELGPLEETVQAESKQMQFQHTELLGARANIKQLTQDMHETESLHQETVVQVRQFLSTLRFSSSSSSATPRNKIDESVKTTDLQNKVDCMIVNGDLLQKCMSVFLETTELQLTRLVQDIDRMQEHNDTIAVQKNKRKTLPEERIAPTYTDDAAVV